MNSEDILETIFKFLPPNELLNVRSVCKQWKSITNQSKHTIYVNVEDVDKTKNIFPKAEIIPLYTEKNLYLSEEGDLINETIYRSNDNTFFKIIREFLIDDEDTFDNPSKIFCLNCLQVCYLESILYFNFKIIKFEKYTF